MVRIIISIFLIGISLNLVAQEVEISDDELQRFAIAMDSVDQLKDLVGSTVKEMVGNTEDITPSRYNALYKVSKNEEKLTELEATDLERQFLAKVDNYKDSMTSSIKTTFTGLAKDYVGDGGRTYNKINKALKTDEALKDRYNAIRDELKASRESSEESDN